MTGNKTRGSFQMVWARTVGRVGWKARIALGGIALLVVLFSIIDLDPDLSHLDHVVLSGPEEGNYYALTEELKSRAGLRRGHLENLATHGSVENMQRLQAASTTCEVHFGLVQDGLDWPADHDLVYVGRFAKAESVLFFSASQQSNVPLSELAQARIGVGPEGSGTHEVARHVFDALEVPVANRRLVNGVYPEQFAALMRGELDFAAVVIDEDAELVRRAVKELGMHLVSFEHLDALARRLDFARMGRIAAAQVDLIAVLPPTSVSVLRIDTLLLSNQCASRSEVVALLRLLDDVDSDFSRHNHEIGPPNGVPQDGTAQSYFVAGGVGFVDHYFPWVVDIMPMGNWVYVVMFGSVLFNLMAAAHRYQLYKLDDARNDLREELRLALSTGQGQASTEPKRMDEMRQRARGLLSRCRTTATNFLVPMGAEMAYRYQEQRLEELLNAMGPSEELEST